MAIKAINALKADGMPLARDDFGTGLTGAYLKYYDFTHVRSTSRC